MGIVNREIICTVIPNLHFITSLDPDLQLEYISGLFFISDLTSKQSFEFACLMVLILLICNNAAAMVTPSDGMIFQLLMSRCLLPYC